jgi:hypothetical protein
MNDRTYYFIADLLDSVYWNGTLLGEENLPEAGGAVLIGNHLDAAGPIGIVCSVPCRVHPWAKADMMDKDLAPAWLQQDFTERQLHLKPPYSRWLAEGIATLSVPLFQSLGSIPVYRGRYGELNRTLSLSLNYLCNDEFVLVFPEDNEGPRDPVTGMQPFQHSFVRLGEMYHAKTGKALTFIPVATHNSRKVRIGKGVVHNPRAPVGIERRMLKDILEQEIIRMYLELDGRVPIQETYPLPLAR